MLPNRKSKIHAYLCDINRNAKLVKFTLEGDKPNPEKGGWPIFASVKLVTGVKGGSYTAEALENLVLLWLQDIAELFASPGGFALRTLMRQTDPNDG